MVSTIRKIALLSALLTLFLGLRAQCIIEARVTDAATGAALPWCNVWLIGQKNGTITNAEGLFRLEVKNTNDSLMFSYLGYRSKTLSVRQLKAQPLVGLNASETMLDEITVHAGNEYLYDIFESCRKQLQKNRTSNQSKVYFVLETLGAMDESKYPIFPAPLYQTYSKNYLPVELLECFYNANLQGEQLEKLEFKNGKTALAANGNYFVSRSTSLAWTQFSLSEKNDLFPAIPFQFSKSGMKKLFNLEFETYDGQVYTIKFTPLSTDTMSFSGKAWIEKSTMNLLKIELFAEHPAIHPFLPFHEGLDSLYNVSLQVSNSYKVENGVLTPDHFHFSYSFDFISNRDFYNDEMKDRKTISRHLTTHGLMYFFDYGKPFIIPFFNFPENYDDYYRMSFIPYNEACWNSNQALLLTSQQKENLGILSKENDLELFSENNYGRYFLKLPHFYLHGFFAFYYPFWDAEKRILILQSNTNQGPLSQKQINNSIPGALYNIEAQILLDINPVADSLNWKSYTIMDAIKTYWYLPIDKNTHPFVNMYFDICEIERRRMEQELAQRHGSLTDIETVYREAVANMQNVTKTYLKEVQHGTNEKQMRKWNTYVIDELGIDNLALFKELEPEKQ